MATPVSSGVDSSYAWGRLAVALALSTIGGVGLWSTVVVLPVIEAEFGVDRGGASAPYTATMIGFAIGGVAMGRLADRFGIALPLILGAVMLGLGYLAASQAGSYWQFVAIQTVLIGMLGASATFGPLVADVSLWFVRRRGIAVAIVASGNYLAGAVWPPILNHLIETVGWRQTHLVVGIICLAIMLPLILLMRRRPHAAAVDASTPAATHLARAPLPPSVLMVLLCVAGIACCVAMSMPQVHMIAYTKDLGYGAAAGATMLSVMLITGVISRLISGLIADRIGGLGTLVLGSALQTFALILYLPFDGLVSLYAVAAIFGFAQGGIVPSYALIVREYYPAREAGWRVSVVLMATVMGMAFGGWISGEIHDLTQSYTAAFLNGIAWNILNLSIAGWLLMRRKSAHAVAA